MEPGCAVIAVGQGSPARPQPNQDLFLGKTITAVAI
jgi:hypothetical protein